MNGVSPFVLNACAMPLAQACHRGGMSKAIGSYSAVSSITRLKA